MQAGLLSREINVIGVPTPSQYAEGNIVGGVIARRWADPRGHENLCMYGAFMSENRESPRSPVVVMARAGRSGKAKAVIP